MKRGSALLAALAALAGLLAPAPASAAGLSASDRQEQIDAEVRRLREEVGEVAEQEAGLLAELTVSRRLRGELDTKVAALDAQIAVAEVDLDAVNAELARAIAAQKAAARSLERARRQLEDATQDLKDQAVQAFIYFGIAADEDAQPTEIDAVAEAARRDAYAAAVAEAQGEVIDRQRMLKRDTTALEAGARAAQSAAARHRQEIADRKEALQVARNQQAAARAEIQAELAKEQDLLAQVQARRGQYERRLAELERESSNIADELRRRQAGQPPAPVGRGVLGLPVSGGQVRSAFGYRIHPIFGDRRLHAGVDFSGTTGTPILAAAPGTVVHAGWRGGYGNTVIIDHGGSLATLYAHQDAVAVTAGDTVRKGQVVGYAGSTGNSTGPHLHFEVRVGGTPVDPMRYL